MTNSQKRSFRAQFLDTIFGCFRRRFSCLCCRLWTDCPFGVQNVSLRSVTVTFCALFLAAVRELGPKVHPKTETDVWTVSAPTRKQREQSKIENKKKSIKKVYPTRIQTSIIKYTKCVLIDN